MDSAEARPGAEARAAGEAHGGERHAHAGTRTYVGVAIVLAVLTALEVAVFFIPALRPVLIPLLLVLMAGKFILVAMFYMHLKTDDALYTALFLAPVAVAVSIILALLLIFRVLF